MTGVLALLASGWLAGGVRAAGGALTGTYRCYRHTVAGGKDDVCSTPALILRENGSYEIPAVERGSYAISGGKITLSESKSRGPGRFMGDRIVFEYSEKGILHRVTYLRQAGDAAATAVRVAVSIDFGAGDGAKVSAASLVPQGASLGLERFDSLAWADGPHRAECSFRNVPVGKVYTLYAGTEREMRPMGTVDLRGAKGTVRLSLSAPQQ